MDTTLNILDYKCLDVALMIPSTIIFVAVCRVDFLVEKCELSENATNLKFHRANKSVDDERSSENNDIKNIKSLVFVDIRRLRGK